MTQGLENIMKESYEEPKRIFRCIPDFQINPELGMVSLHKLISRLESTLNI